MKKILLIILTIILILSVNVLAVDIDMGMPAINRSNVFGIDFTLINIEDIANESGTITSVEIWADSQIANCKVAIFYGSGATLSTRDYEVIGTVAAGSKQTFTVDLDVEAGDIIGMFYTSGGVERDVSGFAGVYYVNSDQIPCTDYTFSLLAGNAISLKGIGATVVVGWDHKWNTQTISKWNTKEFTKWNGLE